MAGSGFISKSHDHYLRGQAERLKIIYSLIVYFLKLAQTLYQDIEFRALACSTLKSFETEA